MITQYPISVVLYRTKLTPLQRKYLLEDAMGLDAPTDDTMLGPLDVLLAWIASFLNQLHWLDEGQWRLILHEMPGAVFEMAPTLGDGESDGMISFVDAHYATWTGTSRFLDLNTGEWIDRLAHRGFEHIGYDLLTLAVRESARCTQLLETQKCPHEA